MPQVKCLNCNTSFEKRTADINRSPNHFCGRSCASSFNNKMNPRRTKTKKCRFCDNLILSNRQRCPTCIKDARIEDKTLGDVIYKQHHASSAYALIRSRARSIAKRLGWKSCCKCGYDKHIEIGHKKPISQFSHRTLVSTINNPKNLLPLCPNCHWEHDNL